MENNVVSEYLLGIEIDGVKQGVVKVANPSPQTIELDLASFEVCLLYTSDAADEARSVYLGGRRIIKKKKKIF